MFELLSKIDLEILLWIQNGLRNEYVTMFMWHITSVGSIALAVMAAWFALKGNGKERVVGMTAFLSAIIEVAIVNGCLKNLFARPRPFVVSEDVVPLVNILSQFSFPSGHTALAFAMAIVFYRLLPKRYGVFAILLASLVGFSRVYLGVHYSSDVVGGIVIAYVAARLAERLLQKILTFSKK